MVSRRCIAACVVLLLTAYALGALSQRHRWPPTPQIERAVRQALWRFRPERGHRDTTGRVAVACAALHGAQTQVWLTLGQSNAANEGELDYETQAAVYNFNPFDGACYEASDPLLGATGSGGSVWTRLADRLIAAGRAERIVIAPIAVGGSRIRRWAPGGDLYPRIGRTAAALDAAGLRVTHVLWHQGESDVDTPPQAYVQSFTAMLGSLRAAGIDAPVYVAQASICKNGGSAALRAVQRQLADELPGVRRGPNSDRLDRFAWRHDLCHFSAAGLDEHARLWFEVLQ